MWDPQWATFAAVGAFTTAQVVDRWGTDVLSAVLVGTALAAVTDVLPAGVRFLTSSSPCDNNNGTLTCQLGPLAAGATTLLGVQVRVPASFTGLLLTNVATVMGDRTPTSATATTAVDTAADLSLTKVCKPDEPAPANSEGYCDIYVDNLGPSDAQNVTLSESTPANTTFV